MVADDSGDVGSTALSTTKQQLLASLRQSHESTSSRDQSVLPLRQSSNSQAIAVLIHPVAGAIFCYAPLAPAFDSRCAVYGLPGDLRILRATASGGTGALAARYASDIEQYWPDAAFLIGGWSYGGLVAWEIAQLLSENKPARHVEVLLLDTHITPEGERNLSEAELFEYFVADILQQPFDITDQSHQHKQTIPSLATETGMSELMLAEYFEMFCINSLAFAAHRPTEAVMGGWSIQASDSERPDWQGRTSGRINTIIVPGNHYSFLKSEETAAYVRRASGILLDKRPAS